MLPPTWERLDCRHCTSKQITVDTQASLTQEQMLKRPKDTFISLNLFKGHQAHKISGSSHIISRLLNFDIAHFEEKLFHLEKNFRSWGRPVLWSCVKDLNAPFHSNMVERKKLWKRNQQELHVFSRNSLGLQLAVF